MKESLDVEVAGEVDRREGVPDSELYRKRRSNSETTVESIFDDGLL